MPPSLTHREHLLAVRPNIFQNMFRKPLLRLQQHFVMKFKCPPIERFHDFRWISWILWVLKHRFLFENFNICACTRNVATIHMDSEWRLSTDINECVSTRCQCENTLKQSNMCRQCQNKHIRPPVFWDISEPSVKYNLMLRFLEKSHKLNELKFRVC